MDTSVFAIVVSSSVAGGWGETAVGSLVFWWIAAAVPAAVVRRFRPRGDRGCGVRLWAPLVFPLVAGVTLAMEVTTPLP
ncbi:hypothetical protein [Glycomyces salinus]|uniref:hypothetical protein n=1 Tax=Glycomyces salinus TaxID=980294 RepID=UPI0018ED0D8E|nr:hypothetical protein [Glycomyces salinus]